MPQRQSDRVVVAQVGAAHGVKGEVRVKAFTARPADIAAYEIGKLLGLSSIPPSVERRFDGRKSAFTWWIDDAVTLADMKSRGMKQPDMGD